MKFFNQLKQYTFDNKHPLYLLSFLTLIAYGYFITNWSLGVDSEMTSFLDSNIDNKYVYIFGRFTWYALDIIHNNQVIPFWNDFLSILLLFLSAIIWSMQLSTLNQNKRALFIFASIYIISPIYVFYLRFTIFDVSIGIGILFMSIAGYYFSRVLQQFEQEDQYYKEFLLGFMYTYLSIGIYQMFAVYSLSSILFIVNHRILLTKIKYDLPYFKSTMQWMSLGLLLLGLSTIMYEGTCSIVSYFFGNDPYINTYISWGTHDIYNIFAGLKNYLVNLVFIYHFNFFLLISLFFLCIFVIVLIHNHIKNFLFVITLSALLISAFFLPLALGTPMPMRTLQNIPLTLAGFWLIFYLFLKKEWAKNACMVFICIATFFNAQYIVRLFYSDNVRLQQDINFSNHIYQFILNHVGSHIYSKPLVIVGKHHAPIYPFTLKSGYDVLGLSFYEIYEPGVNELSKHRFMSWLGNQYIKPTVDQEIEGWDLSKSMPTFPDAGSVLETDKLVVLKLSNNPIKPNQPPIQLNNKTYQAFPSEQAQSAIDILSLQNNIIYIEGWSILKHINASNTNVYIQFKSPKKSLIFPSNSVQRIDIAKAFRGSGVNLEQTGFKLSLNTTYFTQGVYHVSLILINDPFITKIHTEKVVKI